MSESAEKERARAQLETAAYDALAAGLTADEAKAEFDAALEYACSWEPDRRLA